MKYKAFIGYFLIFVINIFFAATSFGATIDLLIVYDTTGKAWVDNHGGMNLFSQQAVDKLNQAMANSNINLTFRLAHTGQVSYTHSNFPTIEAGFSRDLEDLQAGRAGLSQAHAWRDAYGADIVVMFVDTGQDYGTVGLGYELSRPSGSPNYAFNVNNVRSVLSGHTLAHEIGHNFGAGHSKYQTQQRGPGIFSYSAGWYFTGTDGVAYHTIMAYNRDGYGNYYTEAPLFSTPLKTYQGTTAGHPQDGDNSRTIRETMDVVAAYRSSSTPSCSFYISPKSNSFASTGGTGSVNVTASSSSCSWTASSNATWISITSGSSGAGNGAVSYSVSQNTSSSSRTGTLTIAEKTFTVSQSGTQSELSIGEAVDNTSLVWTTGGNANWAGQSAIYYYGGDAAKSGAITHNQSTWMQTTVTGPGTLTFYWKASSEADSKYCYDWLSFYVDSNEMNYICGETNWAQKTYQIASGTHTLKWEYVKDQSQSSGRDAGWVDYVTWQPSAPPPTNPSRLIACDLNGDFKDDIAKIDGSGNIFYSTNLTNWKQMKAQLFKDIACGDLNGDNMADIAGVTSDGKIWFTLDKGENWKNILGELSRVFIADINGDFKGDILGLSPQGYIYITYDLSNLSNIPGVLYDIQYGDFDLSRAGNEFAGINANGHVYYTTNLVNWNNIPGSLKKLFAVDIDSDGKSDLIGINSSNEIYYTTNLTTWENIPGGLVYITTGDFNGDGKNDIIGLNSANDVYYTTNLSFWTNIPGKLTSLATGDFNGDGKDDVAGIGTDGKVYYTVNLTHWGELDPYFFGNF